jgi:hypothetical protein
MTDIASVVETYIASWNEGDESRRRSLVERTWTSDGTYVDPLMSGAGADGITAMIGAAREQFPGHRFELSFGPDAHNGRARFAWNLVGEAGTVASGVDFAVLAPDGRFEAVTGFLG